MAINAGIDMAMEPYDLNYCTLLKELVQEKKIPMNRIDDAVRRVLRLKFRLGLFDHPNTLLKDYPLFGSKEHALIALHAAEESEVLLKIKIIFFRFLKGKATGNRSERQLYALLERRLELFVARTSDR